jgi:hypothetical protein
MEFSERTPVGLDAPPSLLVRADEKPPTSGLGMKRTSRSRWRMSAFLIVGSLPSLTGNHFCGSLFSRPTNWCDRCRRLLFLRSVLREKRPSIASMTNIEASTADDGSALATSSCSFRLVAFEGLPFALKILVRHFPRSCWNALISNPLYCMARPVACLHGGAQR